MLLTVSGYVFPLLTFPYVTRVLGADNLGLANFAMSFVDYAVLFSTLGLSYIGCREISQNSHNKEKLSDVFSKLVTLHILMSLFILLIYLPCIFIVPEFSSHKQLYLVGILKIFSNILLVGWLYEGLQKFRFVTIRTLIVKLLYVFSIFIFVRSSNDFDTYFYLSIVQVALNGIINWQYSHKFVSFSFNVRKCTEFFFPVLSMGLNLLLFSFYGSFNVLYLGIKCSSEAVGYYTTSIKLYSIMLAVISAYNGVLVPYLNNLYGQGNFDKFKDCIEKTLPIVFITAIPIIVIGTIFAREIIYIIAGDGFERSILPFQIVLIQVLVVGLAQIFENQILLSFKKYKEILLCTIISVSLAIIIIILFVSKYAEIASAYAVAIPHIVEVILLYFFAKKCINFSFCFPTLIKVILTCLPIAFICFCTQYFIRNSMIAFIIGCTFSAVYYLLVQCYIIKNVFILSNFERVKHYLKRTNTPPIS